MRVEEPIRELVVDLPDGFLQREVVIDARRNNVDLDRGELLPTHRMGALRRYGFLVGADMRLVDRYVALPTDFAAPVDTAGVVVVSRAVANYHRLRAQRLMLEIPDHEGPIPRLPRFEAMAEEADREAERSRRWKALADRMLEPME